MAPGKVSTSPEAVGHLDLRSPTLLRRWHRPPPPGFGHIAEAQAVKGSVSSSPSLCTAFLLALAQSKAREKDPKGRSSG